MFFLLSLASLLASALCTPFSLPPAGRTEYGRTLTAATRRSSLLARSNDLDACLKHKVELTYAETYNIDGERNYAAKVTITSSKHILVLEEMEHLLDDLNCAPASITLSIPSFGDASVLEQLYKLRDGHIITSHSGCNVDGERQAYSVLDIDVLGADVVIFSVVPVPFKTAFASIEVEMGYTEHAHELRSTPAIARRDSSEYSLRLDSLSAINKAIFTEPGDFPIDISCKNCSLWGEMDLEFASFSWKCGVIDSVENVDSPSDCISGVATASAKGMGGIVQLEASVAKSWSHEFPLFAQALLPQVKIKIPNIGSGSLTYGPYLDIGYDFVGNVDMIYGFDMQVPDGAKVELDVGHPGKSGASGFAQTKINTIPFQSTAKIQTIGLHAALRSQIQIDFNFDTIPDVSGSAKAKVYVDTPYLKAQVTPVNDIDIHCHPVSGASGSEKKRQSSILSDAIHIGFTSSLDYGYYLGAEVEIADMDEDLGSPIKGSANMTKPEVLADMCLNFDEKTKSYESASEAVAKAEHNATKAEHNAASAGVGRVPGVLYVLALTVALFAAL